MGEAAASGLTASYTDQVDAVWLGSKRAVNVAAGGLSGLMYGQVSLQAAYGRIVRWAFPVFFIDQVDARWLARKHTVGATATSECIRPHL